MSEGAEDAAERDAREVESMVPDEGKVSVLTRAEMLKAITLAWCYGQASLAGMVTSASDDEQRLAASFACARLAMQADKHPVASERIAALAVEGFRPTSASSDIVIMVEGGDGNGE